jgi:hypothetical protein
MEINNMTLIMIRCLSLTIIIEGLLAFILGVRKKKDFLNIILVNIVTNPIVVTVPYLVFMLFGFRIYKYSIYILEVLAFLIEGLIYYKVLDYKKINPFIISAILNLSSYGLGLLLDGVW